LIEGKWQDLYLCQRYGGKKLKEIVDHFGIGESGVSRASRRVHTRIESERVLKNVAGKIEKRLILSSVKN